MLMSCLISSPKVTAFVAFSWVVTGQLQWYTDISYISSIYIYNIIYPQIYPTPYMRSCQHALRSTETRQQKRGAPCSVWIPMEHRTDSNRGMAWGPDGPRPPWEARPHQRVCQEKRQLASGAETRGPGLVSGWESQGMTMTGSNNRVGTTTGLSQPSDWAFKNQLE